MPSISKPTFIGAGVSLIIVIGYLVMNGPLADTPSAIDTKQPTKINALNIDVKKPSAKLARVKPPASYKTSPTGIMKPPKRFTQIKSPHDNKKTQTGKIVNIFRGVPKMTLVYRLTSKRKVLRFFFCTALRTATLYWSPYLGNVALILDKESEKDPELVKRMTKYQKAMGFKFEFYYEPTIKKIKGYHQQLYSTFIMDKYIKTPVIAYTDTDAKFTTPITLDDIFTGTKLKAKGVHTTIRNGSYFDVWRESNKILLGFPMVADSMSYFPVFLWTNTITNCRNHIIKHTKSKTIEEALSKLGRNTCPVCVLLSFAFHFEKNRYDWHIDIRHDSLEDYNNKFVPTGPKLLPTDITPVIHLQIHDKHFQKSSVSILVNKQSYCRAVRETTLQLESYIPAMCKPFRNLTPWYMYNFEYNRFVNMEYRTTWCKDKLELCQSLIEKHYEKSNEYVRLGIYDLDLKRVKVVEKAAVEHRVKCRAFWIDDYHYI